MSYKLGVANVFKTQLFAKVSYSVSIYELFVEIGI